MNCHRLPLVSSPVVHVHGRPALLHALILLVVLGTAAVHGLEIVAIGDSYAAGVGARDKNDCFNYEDPVGCFRSPTSYSALFAQLVGADKFTNVACGGGNVRSLTRERILPLFPTVPRLPWQSCEELSPKNSDEFYKPAGQFSCERYVRPQIDAVTNTTDLVILTVGGNDIGGSGVYLNCFSDFIRDEQACANGLNRSRTLTDRYESNLIDFLAEIEPLLHNNAKVALVNYPRFVEDKEYTFGSINPNPDVQARDIKDGLNQAMIRAATTGNNPNFVVVYNSTAQLFDGHEVDPRLGPLKLNPDRWILEPVWDLFTGDGPEGFHMNAKGNRKLALAMKEQKHIFGL